jgi:SAM-dependent methyltransferase
MSHNNPNIKPELPQRTEGNAFAEQYIALRKKEQRLYTDEEVRQLPLIPSHHPHYREWLARKRSFGRLLKHISKMQTPPHILEVGCGNGWLSHKMSGIAATEVTGYDINQTELYQARKVFGHRLNLQFTAKDPFADDAKNSGFDMIVFAASLQYFASLDEIISKAMRKLLPGGSIHIIDTHFYSPQEVPAAQKRTEEYFSSLGFADMSASYFHHSLEELQSFNPEILYDPNSFWNKFTGRKGPFHWVRIKKNK